MSARKILFNFEKEHYGTPRETAPAIWRVQVEAGLGFRKKHFELCRFSVKKSSEKPIGKAGGSIIQYEKRDPHPKGLAEFPN